MSRFSPQKKGLAAHLSLAHSYWESIVSERKFIVDATCGGGKDTLILAQMMSCFADCHLCGFDIQPQAIERTRALLKAHLEADVMDRICLQQCCHSKIEQLAPFPDLVVYNLGYLPGGDKAITTQTDLTLESLEQSSRCLKEGGAISVMCYSGHAEGEKEERAILKWASSLASCQWQACHHRWVNRYKSPSFLWLRKSKTTLGLSL